MALLLLLPLLLPFHLWMSFCMSAKHALTTHIVCWTRFAPSLDTMMLVALLTIQIIVCVGVWQYKTHDTLRTQDKLGIISAAKPDHFLCV